MVVVVEGLAVLKAAAAVWHGSGLALRAWLPLAEALRLALKGRFAAAAAGAGRKSGVGLNLAERK